MRTPRSCNPDPEPLLGHPVPAQMLEIPFGKRTFTVLLDYQARTQLSVTVHPDSTITAFAPVECNLEKVRERLCRRAAWIARQIDYFHQFQPLATEPRYLSGETHVFLGRQYRLNVQLCQTSGVSLKGAFFEINLPDHGNVTEVKRLLQAWRTDHSKKLFRKRLQILFRPFIQRGAIPPLLSIRHMQKRWGSCSPARRITLNTDLLKAPLPCIDYVIVHELCHLLHSNHDRKFFRLLQQIMPDWEKRKHRLERVRIKN